MTGPVRVGLVGAGRIGAVHAQAITGGAGLELAAVCDPQAEAAAAAAAPAGARVAATVPELLAGGGVDAFVVAAPTSRHPELVTELAAAGLPILCEKPLGLTASDAQRAAGAAAAAGILLAVGYWKRFVPELIAVHDGLADGALGALAMAVCVQWDAAPPPAAFRDPAVSGGILVDMGVHEFDMLRWLTGGTIERIVGAPSAAVAAAPVPGDPETANLVASLSTGASAVVTLSRCHPGGDRCSLDVLATGGVRAVEFLRPDHADADMLAALRRQDEAFGRAVRGAPWPGAAGADAVAALQDAAGAAEALALAEAVA
ncbi:MAG: Gfo/Idh/MocA family oxidoreductase [Solirubrobacteraceae bacterium]